MVELLSGCVWGYDVMNIEQIKQIYGNNDGYICCDVCPIQLDDYDGLGFCPQDCTGYSDAWEAILKFLSREDDSVNHPSHYTRGKIEVIDFIADQKLNVNRGNAIKYICRAGFKGDEIEDLEKAIVYLQHEIKVLKDNG